MNMILLGAPGAGKGTQAKVLSEKLDIPHISTGDIFRENIRLGTELGKKAEEIMDKGMLVPDEITIGIVKERLKNDDCKNGFILDGFPRTVPQAESLDKILSDSDKSIDVALYIYVSDEVIVERMGGRRICPNCGKVYHIIYIPCKNDSLCDACNTEVVQRPDDKEEVVLQRLKSFHQENEKLIEYYKNKDVIVTVEGREDVEHTTQEVLGALKGLIK